MILRKPYAFLIKYFKLIHLLMLVLFTYLIFALRPIYIFTLDYINGNNNMYFDNMASKYIPSHLFIIVIVVLALSIGIFFLMRKKEKPVLFYKLAIIYSILLLFALIYFYFFFKSLSTTNYNNLRIVINRDIIAILYYLNFLFVGFTFIRTSGFDIKKFSFDKDRRELKLEETDSEEYEVDFKLEKEDVVNYFNRQKRELKYYVEENSKILKILLGLALISIMLYFVYDRFVVNKIYQENANISIGNITYNVRKSLISTYDKYGKEITDENNFLVVYITISNNGNKQTLSDQQFRVNVNDVYYYPLVSYCGMFDDLGTCYHDINIGSNSKQDYIMVFKLEKNYSNAYFEILKSKKNYQYSKVKLNIEKISKEIKNYVKGDVVNINNDEFQVINHNLLNKTTYKYESCINNKCSLYTKIVKPKLGNQILAIEINNLEKLSDEYLKNYIGLKYRDNILYGSDLEVVDRHHDMLYLSIPTLVHEEDKLVLIINARSIEYDILLKEGINA